MANVESSRMNADELTAQCLQMKFVQLESVHARFCQSFVDRQIARREKESAAKLAHVESTLIDLNEEPRDADEPKLSMKNQMRCQNIMAVLSNG
ncbi:hypothetical protein BS78_K010700 [Paspalum vaginatum]|uniref:Uncharacterized protein n=1 Tax=Paspalum vaginatum TaxID=158149 RepID=A0A9W8CFT0_9POAL|nr:hypothetical protein BS78_K010700 [Paspalum vaginatum]